MVVLVPCTHVGYMTRISIKPINDWNKNLLLPTSDIPISLFVRRNMDNASTWIPWEDQNPTTNCIGLATKCHWHHQWTHFPSDGMIDDDWHGVTYLTTYLFASTRYQVPGTLQLFSVLSRRLPRPTFTMFVCTSYGKRTALTHCNNTVYRQCALAVMYSTSNIHNLALPARTRMNAFLFWHGHFETNVDDCSQPYDILVSNWLLDRFIKQQFLSHLCSSKGRMQGPSSKRSVGFSGAESISLNTVPVVPRTPQHDEVPRIMNGKKNVPPKVLISYNCLLVPVVVAFWWYWTRKTARKVVSRLFVTSGNETCHNDESNGFEYDEFSSWWVCA